MPFPFDMPSGGEASHELRPLSSAVGPINRWCAEEDGAAAFGNTLSVQACVVAVEKSMLECWRRRISLDFRFAPPAIVLQDYQSVKDQPDIAAAGVDRLASLGKIHW